MTIRELCDRRDELFIRSGQLYQEIAARMKRKEDAGDHIARYWEVVAEYERVSAQLQDALCNGGKVA